MIVSVTDYLAVLAMGGVFLSVIGCVAAFRPVLFISFFFILFTLAWRTGSTMFIDLAGPVYSSQTQRWIGPGLATPIHVMAYLLTVIPFLWFFQSRHTDAWAARADLQRSPRDAVTLSDVTYVVSALFVGWLFVDLTRIGVVPLVDHMERFDYTENNAGLAHRALIEYGNLICLWWGMMFAAEKIRNNAYDIRYLTLMGVLLVYVFLVGNRFSAFYSFGSFFAMPMGAVLAIALAKRPMEGAFSWLRVLLRPRELKIVGAISAVLALVMVTALYNNLVNVRGYDQSKAWTDFLERTLVQPSELGWISYERTFERGDWQSDWAFDFLFFNPIDPSRNTTPQFLMLETIGEPRTSDHILRGFQFAGGFPEIFVELFGPYFAWPFLFGASWLAAGLLALLVRSVVAGRYITAFLAGYVLYGFLVMYIGGMLNFVTVWTYWIKVTALVAALSLDHILARRGRTLLPWVINLSRLWPLPAGKEIEGLRHDR